MGFVGVLVVGLLAIGSEICVGKCVVCGCVWSYLCCGARSCLGQAFPGSAGTLGT